MDGSTCQPIVELAVDSLKNKFFHNLKSAEPIVRWQLHIDNRLNQILLLFIYANLVNFEVYLKVPVSLDKMVKVWMLKNLCLIAQ